MYCSWKTSPDLGKFTDKHPVSKEQFQIFTQVTHSMAAFPTFTVNIYLFPLPSQGEIFTAARIGSKLDLANCSKWCSGIFLFLFFSFLLYFCLLLDDLCDVVVMREILRD